MTYVRVDALGSSGKSLQYVSNPLTASKSEAAPSVVEEASTSIEPEVVIIEDKRTMQELIKEATDLAMQADNTLEKSLVVEMLNRVSREDLIDTINSLKAQANDITDQQGNKIC